MLSKTKNYVKEYNKEYYKKNITKILKKCKENRKKNPEKYRERYKSYYNKHYKKILEHHKKYNKIRFKNDIKFKLLKYLRRRIYSALQGNIKSLNTMFLIGCEIDYLMYHIQNKFTKGMSWDNYGLWHIDHIKPCASFDMSKPEEQRECFHYSNLQPLWAIDNIKKSDN